MVNECLILKIILYLQSIDFFFYKEMKSVGNARKAGTGDFILTENRHTLLQRCHYVHTCIGCPFTNTKGILL